MVNTSKFTKKNLFRVATRKGIRGIANHLGTTINQFYYKYKNHQGTNIIEEDWDNLLILDGCRYDMFVNQCDLQGEITYRISHASESSEFIHENFINRELHDTIYVTGNPHAYTIPDGTFFKTLNILKKEWKKPLRTVPPEYIAKELRITVDEHPNKRVIGHFMQPHIPFIGKNGISIDSSGINPNTGEHYNTETIWSKLKWGLGVQRNEVWEGYRENLEVVMEVVERLVKDLSGKTVITSDHGNLVGDRCRPIPSKGYGHPHQLYVEELVKVPWFILPYDSRRKVIHESSKAGTRLDGDTIEKRLRTLGYYK